MSSGLVFICALMSVIAVAGAAPVLRPVDLRVEYHTNPLGLDVIEPRFSWGLESADAQVRGQKQSAYQVLVASSKLYAAVRTKKLASPVQPRRSSRCGQSVGISR